MMYKKESIGLPMLLLVVGAIGIEPTTSTMSR